MFSLHESLTLNNSDDLAHLLILQSLPSDAEQTHEPILSSHCKPGAVPVNGHGPGWSTGHRIPPQLLPLVQVILHHLTMQTTGEESLPRPHQTLHTHIITVRRRMNDKLESWSESRAPHLDTGV